VGIDTAKREVMSAAERLVELRRRWAEDPSSRIFLHLAEEYRRMGRSDEAAEVLRQGLERNPQYLSAQVALGRCLLDLGRPQAALATLEQVLERDATHLVAGKLLVEAHLQRGDALRARRQLDLYASLNPKDPEIDPLRERIEALVLADAEPEPAPVPAVASEAPQALDEEAQPPALPEPFAPAVSAGVPAGAADSAAGNGRMLLATRAADPFPGLLRGARRGHRERLAREGLFPLVRRSAAETAAAAEPTVAAPAVAPPAAPEPEPWGPQAAEPARPSAIAPPALSEPTASGAPVGALALETPPAEARQEPSAAPQAALPAPAPPAEEDETVPFAVAPGRVAAAPAPAWPQRPAELPEEPPATATLGELYLRQGHHAEAERIFRAVLQQDPGNPSAEAGLRTLAGLRAGAAAAGDGTGGGRRVAGEGLMERKVRLLRRFLAAVRAAAERDVS
jgi:tetratricopeptide (TPR) repeat protein